MKAKTIRKIACVLSACMVISAVTYGFQRSNMTVQAEETLYGIETLINEIRLGDREYTILELVPNQEAAEIGYLIDGNEPALSVRNELTGEWSGWKKELSKYTTAEERRAYIATLKEKWEAFLEAYGFTPATAPVGYSDYEESDTFREGYQLLSFADELAKGYFEPYGRNDVWKDQRYDVKFYYDGPFGDIASQEIQLQHYYVNATQVTEDVLANLQDSDMLYTLMNNHDYVEAGTWGEIRALLSVSDGDAGSVSGNDSEQPSVTDGDAGSTAAPGESTSLLEQYIALLPELPTYYLVEYLPLQKGEQLRDDTPVYVVNESSIRSNTNGEYQFIPTEDGYEYKFSTSSVYYKGGFENREWFRRNVLNMEEEEVETFPMKVITLTVAEYNAKVQAGGGSMPEYDMVYINSGLASAGTVGYGADTDLTLDAQRTLFRDIISNEKACLMDASILYEDSLTARVAIKDTRIFYLCALLSQEEPSAYYEDDGTSSIDALLESVVEDEDRNFVTENIYSYLAPTKLLSTDFTNPSIYHEGANIEQLQQGFSDVLNEILAENLYREADISGEFEQLSTNISQATVIRHIINYKYRRSTEPKKTIKVLEIEPCMSDEESPDLTEAEIKSWINGGDSVESIEITRMTTAEFIGKIEDINEIYDLVYIGTDKDHMNVTETDSTVFNDSSMDGLIYFHTGDIRYATMELAGILDSEYVSGSKEKGGNVYYYNPVRYGGNDITEEKKNALLSFLDASYPIVVSDEFFESPATVYQDINYGGYSRNLGEGSYDMTQLQELGIRNDDISSIKVKEGYEVVLYQHSSFGGETLTIPGDTSNSNDIGYLGNYNTNGVNWNDQVSSMVIRPIEGADRTRSIDTDHIDNSSFMYDFVQEAMGRSNFYSREDISKGSELFNFYLNRPKVTLENVQVAGTLKDGVYSITQNAKGRFMLQYTFTIANEGAASNNTVYSCDLYIDVNADGKYSNTEAMSDISITWNGQTVDPTQLYAGREYVLTRAVPDGYKGVLPWKLQISQVNNANIHNSAMGYTKLAGLEKEILNILQICRDVIPDPAWWGGTGEKLFSLEEKINDPNDKYHALIYGGDYYDEKEQKQYHFDGISDQFEINVKFMTISQFETAFAANKDILDNYNMLILGFSDAYGEFTDEPINAIVNYINSGKSVLFAHDTIMYWNHPKGTRGITNRNTGESTISDQYYSAVSLTKNLRSLVGMDRYGTVTNASVRKGVNITSADPEWSAIINSGKDIAYKPKSNKTEIVAETQGFTYSIINAKDKHTYGQSNTESTLVYSADETKDGKTFVNRYANLKYSTTYYEDNKFDNGEVRENYNGEVKKLLVTKVNSGQITDYPYKLDDEFRVAYTHNQYYQLDFNADDDNDGQSDLVVWFCLGGRLDSNDNWQNTIYSMSPNDVSNNYYIYNKGNITYTGVGHAQLIEEDHTVNEAKLFINTMIASYNAGIKDPTISVLSEGHADASVITATYSYYDEANNISMEATESSETYAKVYFTVTDINFIKGTRNIAVNCYYGTNDADGFNLLDYPGEKNKEAAQRIKFKNLNSKIYRASDNQEVNAGNLDSAGIYYVLVDKSLIENQIASGGGSSFSLYFEAQSTIRSQGLNNTEIVQTTGKAYSKFDFTRVNLFDLE